MVESAGGLQLLETAMPDLLSSGHIGRLRCVAGEVIFAEGDRDTRLFVIEKGRVRLGRHDRTDRECLFTVRRPRRRLRRGIDVRPGPALSCATAMTDVVAISLEREVLVLLLLARPDVALRFLRIMARRIRSTSSTITDTVYADVAARVAKNLLGLAQRFGVQATARCGCRWTSPRNSSPTWSAPRGRR